MMPEKPRFLVRTTDDVKRRLDAAGLKIQVPVKRGKTHRPANRTELVRVAVELFLGQFERGFNVLGFASSLPGARQYSDDGTVCAMAPMASGELYERLVGEPRIPSSEQFELLDMDRSVLRLGMDVVVRGTVFGSPEELIGMSGRLLSLGRGERWAAVEFEPGRVVEVAPYDLVPEMLAFNGPGTGSPVGSVSADGGGNEG